MLTAACSSSSSKRNTERKVAQVGTIHSGGKRCVRPQPDQFLSTTQGNGKHMYVRQMITGRCVLACASVLGRNCVCAAYYTVAVLQKKKEKNSKIRHNIVTNNVNHEK